jgi:hypothetical protein
MYNERARNNGLSKSKGVADIKLLRRRCCDVHRYDLSQMAYDIISALNGKLMRSQK